MSPGKSWEWSLHRNNVQGSNVIEYIAKNTVTCFIKEEKDFRAVIANPKYIGSPYCTFKKNNSSVKVGS